MKSRLIILLLLLGLLAVAGWLSYDHLTLENLVAQEERLRSVVSSYPVTSVLMGFLLYTVASLIPGTTGKAIVYGWLFGFWIGLLLVNLSLTVAAVIAFLAVRYLFHDWVQKHMGQLTQRIDDALQREGASVLLLLRLVHAPYTLVNYTAGTTDVRATTFCWTTLLGLLPGNIAFVLAGAQLPTLEQIARQGTWSLINVPLLIALSVAGILPIALRWLVRRISPFGEDLVQEESSTYTASRRGAR